MLLFWISGTRTANRVELLTLLSVFVGPRSIFWGNRYPLFRTWDDSALGIQSRGGLTVACALLSLVRNDP